VLSYFKKISKKSLEFSKLLIEKTSKISKNTMEFFLFQKILREKKQTNFN
jgi:hypothetical protein